VELLQNLRAGQFDALVGVNLLREGLDLPEVSMVAILDADKEGFLRSETSLVQTIGRAARNVNAKVILYADTVTASMARAIEETARRRGIQEAYNREHGITPETVRKNIRQGIESDAAAHRDATRSLGRTETAEPVVEEVLQGLEREMLAAAENLEFERAAALRDQIARLRQSSTGEVDDADWGGGGRGGKRGRGGRPSKRVPRPKKP